MVLGGFVGGSSGPGAFECDFACKRRGLSRYPPPFDWWLMTLRLGVFRHLTQFHVDLGLSAEPPELRGADFPGLPLDPGWPWGRGAADSTLYLVGWGALRSTLAALHAAAGPGPLNVRILSAEGSPFRLPGLGSLLRALVQPMMS